MTSEPVINEVSSKYIQTSTPFDYISQDFIFDYSIIDQIKNTGSDEYIFPVVYIIYSKEGKKAYVGESTNITNRLKQHLSNQEKNQLENIKIIFSRYFNKSAVLDIESNLIQYISADKTFKLLNGNEGIAKHQYYQKDRYESTFNIIWDKLKFEKLVKKDILDLQNSDLFKYSPYKSLSNDQYVAITEYFQAILSQTSASTTFIEGSAGTGKTILAVYLIKLLLSHIAQDDLDSSMDMYSIIELSQKVKQKLQTNHQPLKIALVVPMTSLRATLKRVFANIHGLSSKMVIGPNEVTKDRYDLLVVDEAHRLKQRKNITSYAEFDKTNQRLGLGKEGNELDWIVLSSSYQLFFYDKNQSIRPADIEKDTFENLKRNSTIINLQSQMRVQGGKDYIDFVDKLLNTSPHLNAWEAQQYELKLFTSMPEMITAMENKDIALGLCRMISGYSWRWISKKSKQPDIVIDGVELYWNKTNQDWINSSPPMTEMGCIHTTQGYDLNYAGIIFGKEITFNESTQTIQINKEHYHDRNGKAGAHDEDLHQYIVNIYKTMMYRGIKGTFVYCCDDSLRNYFSKFIEKYTQ